MAKQRKVLEAHVWGFSCWATWPVAFHQQDFLNPTQDSSLDELDKAAVMQALFDGTLNGTKMAWGKINELRGTARWNRNYAKYLKKIIYLHTVLVANLDRWFVKFKVTASKGKAPGQGRLNPANGQTLFTQETKVAVEEAKKKAQFILDVLSLAESYQPAEAPTRAKHSLPSYLHKGNIIKAGVVPC